MKTLRNDKRGVFGLTSVQSFFSIMLGIALLAYVMVTIFGSLQTANVTGYQNHAWTAVVNETAGLTNVTTLALSSLAAHSEFNPTCVIDICSNVTGGAQVPKSNYTTSNCQVGYVNTADWNQSAWKCTYNYTYQENTIYGNRANSIIGNTSGGIANFFGSISPVYAILAILIIILVLVVLVRVVQAPSGGTPAATPL